MMDLLQKIYPLHRTLISDDTDQALEITKSYLSSELKTNIHEYACGSKVWTWKIPQRYKVNHAVLKDEDGNIYADFSSNPLYLWSYSVGIKKELTYQELTNHTYTSQRRPDDIPWYFKFYDKTWGFSLEHNKYTNMPQDKKYFVDIDVEFLNAPGLKVLTSYLDYGCEKDFLICTNVCHPYQTNDSLSGLVAGVDLLNRLCENPIKNPTRNINFLVCPETIGSISYLANNEQIIDKTTSAFFTEMIGHKNDDNFILQLSRNSDDLINHVFEYVLKKQEKSFSIRNFERWNDEGNINGPGVNIPCPFISRGTLTGESRPFFSTKIYDEYHTSADNLDIISEQKLIESVDLLEEAIRIYCTNYIPKQKERGIIFLSGLGLHTSFYDDPDAGIFMDKIVYMLEGKQSIFEIALELQMDYWKVKDFIDKLVECNAVEKNQNKDT